MSLGRRYDVNRHRSLLLRDSTPGRYRKLNELEIAQEWARSGIQTNGADDDTVADNRQSLTFPRESAVRPSQSLNEGKNKGKGKKRLKSKSLTGKEETLLRDIPVRHQDVVEDVSRRGQTSVSSVETDEGRPESLVVDVSLISSGDVEQTETKETFTEVQTSSAVVLPEENKVKPKKEKKAKVKDKKRSKSKKNTCEVHKNKDSKFKRFFESSRKVDEAMASPRHCNSCTCSLSKGEAGNDNKSETSDSSSMSSTHQDDADRARKHSHAASTSSSNPGETSRQRIRTGSGSSIQPESSSLVSRPKDKHDASSSSEKSSKSSSPAVPKLKTKPEKPQRSPKSTPSTPEVVSSDARDSPREQVFINKPFPATFSKLPEEEHDGYSSEGRRTPGLISLTVDTSIILHDGDSFEVISGPGFNRESDVDDGSYVSIDDLKKDDVLNVESAHGLATQAPNIADTSVTSAPTPPPVTSPVDCRREPKVSVPLQISTVPLESRMAYQVELSPPAGFRESPKYESPRNKVEGAPELPKLSLQNNLESSNVSLVVHCGDIDEKSDDELKKVWKDVKDVGSFPDVQVGNQDLKPEAVLQENGEGEMLISEMKSSNSDADIKIQDTKIPDINADNELPKVDIQAGMQLPNVDKPDIDAGTELPNINKPEIDADIKLPNIDKLDNDADTNILNSEKPDIDADIKIPNVDKPNTDAKIITPQCESPSDAKMQIRPDIAVPQTSRPAFKLDEATPEDLNFDLRTPDGKKVALPTGPYVGIVVMAPDSDISETDKSRKRDNNKGKSRGDHLTSTSESESSSTTSSSGSNKVKAKSKIEKPKRKGKHGKKTEQTEKEFPVVQPTVTSTPATDSDARDNSAPIRRSEKVEDISKTVDAKGHITLQPSCSKVPDTMLPDLKISEVPSNQCPYIPPPSLEGAEKDDSRHKDGSDEDSPLFRRSAHAPIPVLDLSIGSAHARTPEVKLRRGSHSSDSDTSSSSDQRRKRGKYKYGDYSSEDNRDSFLSPLSSMSSHSPLNVSQTLATTSNPNLNGFDKLDASLAHSTPVKTQDGAMPAIVRHRGHFVVVAIDFGTTFSGYALSFTRDPESVHMMRNWEGGDPGVINQKTPTTILLSPDGEFDSFGFTARDRYHNLTPDEAKKWLYFERFKMVLHHNADLTRDTMLQASNGQSFPALKVFALALRFFKEHALQQLTDQSGITIINDDVRWVITVPAIWKAPAKQFMRQAAYEADLVSPDAPDQLLIALEPEAASIYCRKLRMYQLVPEYPEWRPLQSPRYSTPEPLNEQPACTEFKDEVARPPFDLPPDYPLENKIKGTRYMVVDCGGGTVDITVHELGEDTKLKELYKATGGPYGATAVDDEFINMLCDIFGHEFISNYRAKYPIGWLNLMINWESRKRSASPFKNNSLNVSLPFTFIDYFKKQKGGHIDSVVKKYGNKEVCWSSEGMLRLSPHAMRCLFVPVMEKINAAIGDVLNHPNARNLKYLFLVGGFAESPILQHDIRKEFSPILKVLIPTGVSLAILKGAVLFGLDPTIVNIRRSRLTYGVGVLNRFEPSRHPTSKLVHRDGIDWCTDVFDVFVKADQPVTLGDTVIRSYTPAKVQQMVSVIHIYSSENTDSPFITDPGVKKCGTLCLDLSDLEADALPVRREIQARMMFGDTEVKVSALDVATGRCVRASIDFLNK